MAAITPRLGREQLMSPVERQYFKCVGEVEQGLRGTLGIAMECPSPGEVLSQSHTGLLQMIYVRAEIERAFVGRSFTVMSGRPRPDGGVTDPHTVYLVLDGPIGTGPVWNPIASPTAQAYGLLSWTSKMNCVAAGTMIPVQGRGLLPIEQVVDLVQTQKQLLHVQTRAGWKKVLGATHNGIKPTVQVRAQNGMTLRVTADHLVAAREVDAEAGWIPAGQLEAGQHLVVTAQEDGGAAHDTETFLPQSISGLPRTWSREVGLVLGYLCGDGSFAQNGRVVVEVGEVKRPDLDVIDRIVSSWIGEPGHRGEYMAIRSASSYGAQTGAPNTPTYRLYWENEAFTQFMSTFGYRHGVTSPLRRVPVELFTAPRAAVLGFLAGLLSTDGSVGVTPEGRTIVELGSTSRGLLDDVQKLFLLLGARSSITQPRFRSGRAPQYRLSISSKGGLQLLQEAQLLNRQKRETLNAVVVTGRRHNRDNRVFEVVVDNVACAVYDLTVEDVPEFVANGIVVHNCPSFSLPAGAYESGGTCPGAVAGQSIVPVDKIVRHKRFIDRVLERQPRPVELDLSTAVCQFCYAEGGQYSTGSVQAAQVLRHIWTKQAIATPVRSAEGYDSTLFIETMVAAISGADFKLHGGTVKVEEWELDGVRSQEHTVALPPEPSGRKFFRIHDSGDFFSPEYLAQWKAVANRLPHITFWAPSRVWAVSDAWINHVNRINTRMPDGRPSNLVIRPSAYYVNEHGPNFRKLGPGWAAASTVIMKTLDTGMTPDRNQYVASIEGKHEHYAPGGPDQRYDWSCRAYATDDQKHTCRKAVAPPGMGGPDGKGCRACWLQTDEVVNYALH